MFECFSEDRSYVGAKRTQGPHQLAQKSTRTMPSLAVTSSKFSAVSATVAMISPFTGKRPQESAYVRCQRAFALTDSRSPPGRHVVSGTFPAARRGPAAGPA